MCNKTNILCGNFFGGERPISSTPTHTQWNSTRWALINKRIKLCRWLNGGFSRTNTRCLSNGVPSWAGGSGLMQSQRLDTDLTHVFIQTQLLGNIYYRPVVPGPLHLLWTMPCSRSLSFSFSGDKMRTTTSFHVYFTSCSVNTRVLDQCCRLLSCY